MTGSRVVFRKYTDEATFSRIRDFDTVTDMWLSCLEQYGDALAVSDGDKQATFSQLEADASRIRPLLPAGGKIAAIWLPNSYDFVKAYIAVVTSGNTALIIPPQLPPQAVAGLCMKYGAAALFCTGSEGAAAADIRSKLTGLTILDGTSDSTDKVLGPVRCGAEDNCVMMFTGGSTGKSKAAVLTNEAVMQGTVNGCYGYRDVFGQRYLLCLPLSHVFGLIRNLMTSLYTGSAIAICRNNKDLFRDIALFKPTVFVAVPALVEMALTLSKKFGRNMMGPDMKYIICGAAAVPPYLVGEYAKLGIALFPGYGLTESANLVSGNPESEQCPGSVGLLYPNEEVKLVDGELWLRGRNIMKAYADESENAGAYEDGWFKTGDLARFDDDGFMYITGRIKEIIVLSSGENISPAMLEEKFNALPYIQDSQVFEDIAENGTHILALEVVPRATELTGLPPEEIESFVRKGLEEVNMSLQPYERVNRITVRTTDFERSPSMKIVRYKKCSEK